MGQMDKAVAQAINIANDDIHGYDQIDRWGNPNYDCSGLVIRCCEDNGIPLKTAGATYTGNMRAAALKIGFKDVIGEVNVVTGEGLLKNDILLNQAKHTAFYIGDEKIVHASINEKGTVTGGKSGDQTGKEICIRSYYNKPWDCVLRYQGEGNAITTNETTGGKIAVTANMLILKKGMTGTAVGIWQEILCAAGYSVGVDRSFGEDTEAKTKAFEIANGIADAPHQVGPAAWKVGLELLEASKTF